MSSSPKPKRLFARISKPLLLTLLGVILFVTGIITVLLSPWFQDEARLAVLAVMNRTEGTQFQLDRLRVGLPLRLEVDGLSWVQDGDTMMAARALDARVDPMALLKGRVDVERAVLLGGVYKMGNPDSATMITIHADSALLNPASVRLSPMSITLLDGALSDARVDMYINPNPPAQPKDTVPVDPLDIEVHNLRIRNLTYSMSLLPSIDSLGVTIAGATLADARISMLPQTVDVGKLHGYGMKASYIAPDSATIANTIVAPTDTTPTAPWTVTINDISFDRSEALYTTRGVEPLPGLDFAYIQVDDVTLGIKDFYNQATTVRVPLSLTATERCGVTLTAFGQLSIDEAGLTFSNFNVTTPNGTDLAANGYLGMGDMTTDPDVPVRLTALGDVAVADARLMFPAFKPYMAPMRDDLALTADMNVDGTIGSIDINKFDFRVPGVMTLAADGNLRNVMQPDLMGGKITLHGSTGDVKPWVRMFMPESSLQVPPMQIDGRLAFTNGNYDGRMSVKTRGGDIAAEGSLHGRGNVYKADVTARSFPVQAFMPTLGLKDVTVHLTADGRGFDLSAPATATDVQLAIESLVYEGETYRDITGEIVMHDAHADINLASGNPGLEFTLKGGADFSPTDYAVDASLQADDIDLERLKMSTTPANVTVNMDVRGKFDTSLRNIGATLRLKDFAFKQETGNIYVDAVTAHLNTTDSVVNASVRNRDMYAYFSSPTGLDSLMAHVQRVMPVLDSLQSTHSISVIALQQALPRFNLDIEAGADNALTQILSASQMGFKRLSLRAANDSIINATGRILAFNTSSIRLDTITMDITQHADRLDYLFTVNNRPGTFDNWANVRLDGFFDTNKLGIELLQRNIKGQTGFNIGADLTLDGDSTATLRFNPLTPTIGYQPWTINADNFIVYNFSHRHIDADLHMEGNDSHLAIYTEHAHETDTLMHGEDEDIVIDIAGVKLQDWVTINPFAPTIKGVLAAEMRVNWHDTSLSGDGYVSLNDLVYGKEKVGNLKADLGISTNAGGRMSADMALWVNGQKSITLKGLLNDSTAVTPFNLDLTMIHFPLKTVNAFMPGVARLEGTLNGSLDVSGDTNQPQFDGYLQFDSAMVRIDMLGTTFAMSDVRIPVDSSLVRINDFTIKGCNENPLRANGTVDLHDMATPKIDLALNANNMMIVNSRRAPKGASVYGKAYMGLDATARGTLSFLNVDAKVNVMSGTNVTYVMDMDAQSVIESQSKGDMVKFVNFADSAAVAQADSLTPPEGMMLNLAATLNIQPGTTIGVDLGVGTSDRVQLVSQGTLNYTMSPLNAGRVVGRLNINDGYVRYTPPIMSEKKFNFVDGSYVAFSGDMMNPTLNIKAIDPVRANVSTQGQNSRLIYFDVSLDITGTLNNMDVQFGLSTDDDATVANELASMSPAQRASSAMNLLVTNMYTSGDTKADANLGGNALYSFLTSQLNSWAASTIKGVDLSFGINQYDNTRNGASSQTTSYSYRVSKSLFNDRFKIVVGGNYSSDADPDENLEQNLVNDISFEYLLNAQGTMVVRIFRHTGFESILEGEITQTGVGFVYKRKISRLSDMFRFIRRHRVSNVTVENQPAKATTTANDSI